MHSTSLTQVSGCRWSTWYLRWAVFPLPFLSTCEGQIQVCMHQIVFSLMHHFIFAVTHLLPFYSNRVLKICIEFIVECLQVCRWFALEELFLAMTTANAFFLLILLTMRNCGDLLSRLNPFIVRSLDGMTIG